MNPHYSEEQQQQRELNARHELEQLVKVLLDAARDAWQDQRLWGHGDRARYFGRGADLVAIVDRRLKEISEHPDAGVRADRLINLHDELEAAAIIGGCLKTPTVKRFRAVAVVENRRTTAQAARTAEIILDEFNKLREKYPDKDFKEAGPWVTGRDSRLRKPVDQRLKQEGLRLRTANTIEADTIGRYLAELPFFSD
jgi:hypothetical protein